MGSISESERIERELLLEQGLWKCTHPECPNVNPQPVSEFRQRKDGRLSTRCRTCINRDHRKYMKEKRQNDPEWRDELNAKHRPRSKKSRDKNREERNASRRLPEYRVQVNDYLSKRREDPEFREKERQSRYEKRHGLWPGEFEAMQAWKPGCHNCGRPDPTGSKGVWDVDHDHSCCDERPHCGECVRGLLCHVCNTGEIRGVDCAVEAGRLAPDAHPYLRDNWHHHQKAWRLSQESGNVES